ncbi:hypothetical protein MCUN1_000100 [Malassezia cuniculi]|uniref:Alpha/beta hydrolase n=1 Tax=Malassezia cuniculi TaxID=948313 RepID=A0AAF0EQQ6_9BASI|nr:hypothetical protein MCUN1_000100 [Malassezia cuniculi]
MPLKIRQSRISELAQSNPIAAARMVLEIPGINDTNAAMWSYSNTKGVDDFDHQVPWAEGVPYNKIPSVSGTFSGGFGKLPTRFGKFALNRTVIRSNSQGTASMPIFMNRSFNKRRIRKAMVIFPSMWRDSWRFANILGNVQEIAKNQSRASADDASVLIMAPMFLTEQDMQKGAGTEGDIYFKREGWSVAGTSRGPARFTGISSFEVMDKIIGDLLDRSNYPNLEDLIVIGHSMGGQATLRYSMFKRTSDSRMRFWIGNPGKYTYLSSSRPESTASCSNYDEWPLGVGKLDTMPKYVSSVVSQKGANGINAAFRSERIHYFYGLNDNGGRSDKCTHNVQGVNRLQRGANWVIHLSEQSGGFPSSHQTSYIVGTAHDAYPMLASPESMNYLFGS